MSNSITFFLVSKTPFPPPCRRCLTVAPSMRNLLLLRVKAKQNVCMEAAME